MVKKLSAVIITLNEEKNIARCIRSVIDIADEIIVVDSFSTDKTKDICIELGVKFVQQSWIGYVEQKNFANNLADHDWILSIDADESLSEELHNSIKQVKDQLSENTVYSMNRLTNYCGKWIHHCGWYPDTKIRIFNRKAVRWTGKLIHETLKIPEQFTVNLLKGDLLHFSYYTRDDHYRQIDKFTSLTALEAFENGRKAGIINLFLNPAWKFVRDYLFKAGFLDGKAGFDVCRISAYATYLKYSKLRNMSQ
jgi:glycosyltransferase involved in cell wall biosynthesis